jgi:hypothetical protein
LREALGSWVPEAQLTDALQLVERVHGQQTRIGGGSVLERHIYPVTLDVVRALPDSLKHIGALSALLHDVREDASHADQTLVSDASLSESFSPQVARTVALLTRDPLVSDEQYYRAIAADEVASVIKVYDRINNLTSASALSLRSRVLYKADTLLYVLGMATELPEAHAELQRLASQPEPGTKIQCPPDPIAAARAFGGVTFEIPSRDALLGDCEDVRVGWWTYAAGSRAAVTADARFAVFIPTIQKDGNPVPRETIQALKREAVELGLTGLSQASGVWILGSDESIPEHLRGSAQAETMAEGKPRRRGIWTRIAR